MSVDKKPEDQNVVTFVKIDPDDMDPGAVDAFLEALGFPKQADEEEEG
jgi:hypothetical protein